MPQQFAQSVNGGGFHLKVSDPVLTKRKIGETVYQVRVTEAQPQYPPLRAIKPRTGNGDAMMEIAYKMFQQAGSCGADIWLRDAVAELGLGDETLEDLPLFFIFLDPVKVEEVVDPEAVGTGHPGINRDGSLQGTRGPDPNDIKNGMIVFDGAGLKIDIHEGVQLIQNNIYIIRADSGGDDG